MQGFRDAAAEQAAQIRNAYNPTTMATEYSNNMRNEVMNQARNYAQNAQGQATQYITEAFTAYQQPTGGAPRVLVAAREGSIIETPPTDGPPVQVTTKQSIKFVPGPPPPNVGGPPRNYGPPVVNVPIPPPMAGPMYPPAPGPMPGPPIAPGPGMNNFAPMGYPPSAIPPSPPQHYPFPPQAGMLPAPIPGNPTVITKTTSSTTVVEAPTTARSLYPAGGQIIDPHPEKKRGKCCGMYCLYLDCSCFDSCFGKCCRCDPHCYQRSCAQCFGCCNYSNTCNHGRRFCAKQQNCCADCCLMQEHCCSKTYHCMSRCCLECCFCEEHYWSKCLHCKGRCCTECLFCEDHFYSKCYHCQSKCCTQFCGGCCSCRCFKGEGYCPKCCGEGSMCGKVCKNNCGGIC